MSFYLRKGINVGPVRFNLSKSGIGVSVGVPGFRVGSGPRGNYVHMGRHGLYYRKTLPSSQVSKNTTLSPSSIYGHYEKIDSGSIGQLIDSSSKEVVNEIQHKMAKFRIWPIAACFAFLMFSITVCARGGLGFVVGILGFILTCLAYHHDSVSRTTVLMYRVEGYVLDAYDELNAAFRDLSKCSRIWHIRGKRSRGGSKVYDLKKIRLGNGTCPCIKSNIFIPSIHVGRQKLCFLPDRLLVFEGSKIGAVSYSQLNIVAQECNFISHRGVPPDSKVVDRTWLHSRIDGGPDRRYKYNPSIPTILCGQLHFTSPTGLNELVQVSNAETVFPFKEAIEHLAQAKFNQWLEKIQEVNDDMHVALSEFKSGSRDNIEVFVFSDNVDQLVRELKSIEPPDGAEAAHNCIYEGYRYLAEAIDAADIGDIETYKARMELVRVQDQAFQAELAKLVS